MLKSKKVWAALAGVAIALGTLFTAIGDASAYEFDSRYGTMTVTDTEFSNRCSATPLMGGKVDKGKFTSRVARGIWFMNQGSATACEVWLMIKYDSTDSSTWKWIKNYHPDYYADGSVDYGISSGDDPTPVFSGTLATNVAYPVYLSRAYTTSWAWYNQPWEGGDLATIIFDYDVDGEVDMDCIIDVDLSGF